MSLFYFNYDYIWLIADNYDYIYWYRNSASNADFPIATTIIQQITTSSHSTYPNWIKLAYKDVL